MMQESSNKGMLVGIIAVTVLIFAGLVWAIMNAPGDNGGTVDANATFVDQQNPAKGPADAKVVVHMFSDFQCPACRVAEPALKYAMDKYSDRVRFVWNDFPLETLHANARAAANAARCAEALNGFWTFHDQLYETQVSWSGETDPSRNFKALARTIGLKADAFDSCLAGKSHDDLVQKGIDSGSANSVDRTPTFFINQHRYFTMTNEDWDQAITAALKESP